jgi:hypothetical protein
MFPVRQAESTVLDLLQYLVRERDIDIVDLLAKKSRLSIAPPGMDVPLATANWRQPIENFHSTKTMASIPTLVFGSPILSEY